MNYLDHLAGKARPCAAIAHRGLWRNAPENSLPAIEEAISAGCEVVEIDVRRTADGQFILLHDHTLERMTGLDREPESMTMEMLAGLRLRDRDGGHGNRLTGEKVPRLEDVFDLTRNRICIHLDIKHRRLIPDVIACAQAMRVDQQVDVWADLRTPADLDWVRREISPHGVTFIARTHLEDHDAETQLDLMFGLKPPICEVSFKALEEVAALRDRFDDAGTAVWVNTLDAVASAGFTDTAAAREPEAVWGSLVKAGVSFIQTDQAEMLKAFTGRG
jgi:glycerophosphoryl diester phosphodiesterase